MREKRAKISHLFVIRLKQDMFNLLTSVTLYFQFSTLLSLNCKWIHVIKTVILGNIRVPISAECAPELVDDIFGS